MDNLKVGMDLRWINWKNAKGYKEFQWKDQWVIGLGGGQQLPFSVQKCKILA
jgi:long-chain fatty acid transport protein